MCVMNKYGSHRVKGISANDEEQENCANSERIKRNQSSVENEIEMKGAISEARARIVS